MEVVSLQIKRQISLWNKQTKKKTFYFSHFCNHNSYSNVWTNSEFRSQYLVCSTSSTVSGRRALFVSARPKDTSAQTNATREKIVLGKWCQTSSRAVMRGATDTPTRATQEQKPSPFCLWTKNTHHYSTSDDQFQSKSSKKWTLFSVQSARLVDCECMMLRLCYESSLTSWQWDKALLWTHKLL